MGLKVMHKGAIRTGQRFSDSIWSMLPSDLHDPNKVLHICEDFTTFGATAAVATNVGRYASKAMCYKSYEDNSAAITTLATALGRLSINTASTNNNEAWLQACGGAGVHGKISSSAPRLMLFETRIATAQILTQNFAVLLSEEGLAAADTITDAGAMASKDFIGFRALEDAPSKIDFVYRKAGQSEVEVLAEITTLVADTFVNLGFVLDPDADADDRIVPYVDGVPQSTHINASALDDATFPDGEELAFLIGGKNANADNTYYCEGWRFAYLY